MPNWGMYCNVQHCSKKQGASHPMQAATRLCLTYATPSHQFSRFQWGTERGLMVKDEKEAPYFIPVSKLVSGAAGGCRQEQGASMRWTGRSVWSECT